MKSAIGGWQGVQVKVWYIRKYIIKIKTFVHQVTAADTRETLDLTKEGKTQPNMLKINHHLKSAAQRTALPAQSVLSCSRAPIAQWPTQMC